jgi:aquaporin Z
MHLTYPERFSLKKTIKYIAIQCVAGFLAAMLSWWITDDTFTLAPKDGRTGADVLCVECLYTTALCLVVLSVATVRSTANNSYFGLAIGFTVVASGFGIGPISGCVMNPAVCFGAMMSHLIHTGQGLEYFVIYSASPMIASIGASTLFKLIWATEFEKSLKTN